MYVTGFSSISCYRNLRLISKTDLVRYVQSVNQKSMLFIITEHGDQDLLNSEVKSRSTEKFQISSNNQLNFVQNCQKLTESPKNEIWKK